MSTFEEQLAAEYERPPKKAPETKRIDDIGGLGLSPDRMRKGDASVALNLQRAAGNAGVTSLIEEESPVKEVVGKGGGSPLDASTKEVMGSALGHDLSDVRIHTDAKAADSARSVNAQAYTVGNDIVVDQGKYQPNSDEGKHMLAHELTHVAQQSTGPVDGNPAPGGIKVSDPGDRFEREAQQVADAVTSGSAEASAPAAQRQESQDEDALQTYVQRQEAEEEEKEEPNPEDKEEEELIQPMLQRQEAPEELLDEEEKPPGT